MITYGSIETITINVNGKMILEELTLKINDGAEVLQQVYMVLNYIQMVYNETCAKLWSFN